MKPPQSHKPFLILAVAVTILVTALYAYMYWQVGLSVNKAIAARDIARTQGINQTREKDLVKMYESTAAERAQLGSFFIPRDETVEFIEAIELIGPQAGSEVTLSSIDADPLVNAKPGTRGDIRAHIEAQGPWNAVMKTLMIAERLPYKLRINNVRLDGSVLDGTNREWRLRFDIVGTVVVAVPTTKSIP